MVGGSKMKRFAIVFALFVCSLVHAAPHTHWRILFLETNQAAGDDWFASMNEVDFQNGGVSVPTAGGVGSASSYQNTDPRDPFYAFDGDVNSLWSTMAGVGGPAWLAYAFASPVEVTGVRMVTSGTANRVTRAPELFSLQWSDDGSAWTTAEAFTASGWVDGAYQSFALTAAPPAPPASAASAPGTSTVSSVDVERLLTALLAIGVVLAFSTGYMGGQQ